MPAEDEPASDPVVFVVVDPVLSPGVVGDLCLCALSIIAVSLTALVTVFTGMPLLLMR